MKTRLSTPLLPCSLSLSHTFLAISQSDLTGEQWTGSVLIYDPRFQPITNLSFSSSVSALCLVPSAWSIAQKGKGDLHVEENVTEVKMRSVQNEKTDSISDSISDLTANSISDLTADCLLVGLHNGKIELCRLQEKEFCLCSWDAHLDMINEIDIGENNCFASASADALVSIWSVESERRRQTWINDGSGVNALSCFHDKVISGTEKGNIFCNDYREEKFTQHFHCDASITSCHSLVFSDNNFLVGLEDGSLILFDNRKLLPLFNEKIANGSVQSILAMQIKTSHIIAVSSGDNFIRIFSENNGAIRKLSEHAMPHCARDLAFCAESQELYCACWNKNIYAIPLTH